MQRSLSSVCAVVSLVVLATLFSKSINATTVLTESTSTLPSVDFTSLAQIDARVVRHHKHARRSAIQNNGCQGNTVYGTVSLSKENGKSLYSYKSSCDAMQNDDTVVSHGKFIDAIMTTGWGEVYVTTQDSFTDLEQAYAAGYLEAAMTHERIYQLGKMIKDQNEKTHPRVMDYFRKQDQFLRSKIATVNPELATDDDRYWYQVALVLAQLDGLVAGYNANCAQTEHLTREDLWLLNSDGDFMDVVRAAVPGRVFKKANDMSRAELLELVSLYGRCSALIKWTGEDLLAGHTTWDDYTEMLRFYKHYDFHFTKGGVTTRKASFSSYPGFISSSDDFYILDNGLVLIETTLNILDENLYSLCDPESTVVAWIRNLVANRLANDGKEWCDMFARHNSGTYNDQWMVVDYNKFRPGMQQLEPGTLYIMEQIPGYVDIKDMSAELTKDTFWASYNRPFFEEVNKRSMYHHFTNTHGEMFSYHQCPRAKIFMRDHVKVKSITDMRALMQQNNWQNDPLSKGCPGNAIASRFDVEAPNCPMSRVANGATDSKVTNSELVKRMASMAIAGPTHDQQPAFTWNNPLFANEYHEGQPDTWNFAWKIMEPAKDV
jgi:Phospholipase B